MNDGIYRSISTFAKRSGDASTPIRRWLAHNVADDQSNAATAAYNEVFRQCPTVVTRRCRLIVSETRLPRTLPARVCVIIDIVVGFVPMCNRMGRSATTDTPTHFECSAQMQSMVVQQMFSKCPANAVHLYSAGRFDTPLLRLVVNCGARCRPHCCFTLIGICCAK